MRVGAVVIGRNEGPRLAEALNSVGREDESVVYVDSGSTDDSRAIAVDAGARVVDLDTMAAFTAARARNTGAGILLEEYAPDIVMFLDGDCVLSSGWAKAAQDFLLAHPQCGAVCGRLRERFPERSVYNRLCDDEWNMPVGSILACGGNAVYRVEAFREAGGFNPLLIAGEEPELCFRLRARGWAVWRIDAEMALHDAAMTRFGQWWARMRRTGHAFAEGYTMHGRSAERYNRRQVVRTIVWGAAIPCAIILLSVAVSPVWLALAALYPAQILRMAIRDGAQDPWSWTKATMLTIGKFAEAQGALGYFLGRLRGRQARLIEYK